MAVSKKYQHYDRYLLKGKLRQNGFERWRYCFNAINKDTGDERSFFIEIYYVNPLVSSKNVVISQKSRPIVSSDDLQYALAGTISANSVSKEYILKPSYALIKAGMYGENGKQFNKFIPSSEFVWNKKQFEFSGGGCTFAEDLLSGQIEITKDELRENPEYMCSYGEIEWNIHFERCIAAGPFKSKNYLWVPTGSKTVFAGSIMVDGMEYSVVPKRSYGYVDKSWGENLSNPYYHLSSSNLSSIISGKSLTRSCFAVEGEQNGEIRFHVCLEDQDLKFKFKKDNQFHECIQAPEDGDGEKLHWTLSVTEKNVVVDLDIFCQTSKMYVRDYEVPQGNKGLLKILSGGDGYGEIRVYKRMKNDLELIEHAHVANCVCEFGQAEVVES